MKEYTEAFEQIAKTASQMGVTIEEAANAFNQLAQISYYTPAQKATIENTAELERRMNELECNIYYLNDKADCQIVCNTNNIDLVCDELTELKDTVNQLRSEMDALTVKPKRNEHLEIFDRIFDNSNYPFLEDNIFPEIDFNIKI